MSDYLKILELDVIKEQLASHAVLERTRKLIEDLRPINDLAILNNLLDEVDEAVQITLRMATVPIMLGSDMVEPIRRSAKGGSLLPLELYDVVLLFETIRSCERLGNNLLKEHVNCAHFSDYLSRLEVNAELDKTIRKAIDPTGEILDDASPELKTIRSRIKNIERNIKNKIQELLAKEGSKLSQATVSIRNDRYVLPVKAEYKNSFKGIIHDTSASSLTAYIEPAAVYELNNELNKVREAEKDEIARILRLLSNFVGENEELLYNDFMGIVDLDFIFAKAALAISMRASRPRINNEHRLELINAYHPLLKVPKVIPNSISFGKNEQGIVITGPNTGGKTVLLKTVGLLVLMVKCGLLVPCDETSDIMIYDMICADIGDEQSIANNLSTFSSHMKNIIGIIDAVTPNSLVLFDEIGSGTDPKEGSSLAMAILKYLLEHNISFITTTHYSELKAFAYNHEKVINASVEFDQNTLEPTYKLLLGVPGSSNAFNIARRLGLKEEIVAKASEKSYRDNDEMRTMIAKLETKASELEKRLVQVEAERDKYTRLNQDLSKELGSINTLRDDIIAKANREAAKLVENLTKNANSILNDARKMLDNKDTKLHEIIDLKHQINALQGTGLKAEEEEEDGGPIGVNDQVYVRSYEQYGTVLKELKGGLFEVEVGNVRLKTAESELKKVRNVPKNVTGEGPKLDYGKVKAERKVNLALDLRGERYEDAKILLDRYLDDCQLQNIKQASIIHGYGTGVLREMVQKTLKANKNIDSFRYGGAGEGGSGATIITFK